MRVLIVVHGFPPSHGGGAEIYAEAQARALARIYGDEILVLTRENDLSSPEYRVRIEQRERLTIAWVNNTLRKIRTFRDGYEHPAIGALAHGLIDRFKPDVAHIHHLTCLSTSIIEVLHRAGVPTFFTLHDYWLMCHRGQLLDRDYRVCEAPDGCGNCLEASATMSPPAIPLAVARTLRDRLPAGAARAVRRTLDRVVSATTRNDRAMDELRTRAAHMRAACAHVTHFFAPSECLRQRFIQFGIPSDRITLAPYGFDRRAFEAVARRPRDRQLRIGFLGTLMVSKGPHVLLEAYARLPPGTASVDLYGCVSPYHGDDSYKRKLEPLLSLEGVRVHHTIPHSEIPEALASMDVLVVPSIWPENSPLVISEAFMAGVPVVASHIGGIPEMVRDGQNGLLCRPGDVDELRRMLMRLLEELDLLPSLRSGVPQVRTIDEDVALTRSFYQRERLRLEARAGSASARLGAIVLNYRTPDDTLLAVQSLLRSRRRIDDIIVVDNGASDELRGRLSAVMPRITYLSTGRNLGFAGGMNVGIRMAIERGADQVLMVNSDVVLSPDCVEKLEMAMQTTPRAGIAGPTILSRSDPSRIASLGIRYTSRSGRMRHNGFGQPRCLRDSSDSTIVAALSGCVMLVSRSVFDEVGLLNADYFFSFEDLAFCLSARRKGFKTLLVSDAHAYHHGGRSLAPTSPDRFYFAARNHLRAVRDADPLQSRLAESSRAGAIIFFNLAHAIIATGPPPLHARIAAVVRGTRDCFAGRFGDAH